MAENTKAHGGRPRSGQLVWRKTGWCARVTVLVDGERVRVWRALETDSKAAARVKLARLLEAENPTPTEATRPETFEEAARRVVKGQKAEGLATWKDRLHRLSTFAFPEFGAVPVTAVRPTHIRQALDLAHERGLSRRTIQHVKIDISTVLAELWRDEVLPENAATRVRVPKAARVDDRKRIILSDAEFTAFMACPDLDHELRTMALVSRTFGGMRTSDLHAWDWGHVDTVTWLDAHVSRPKTKSSDRLGLPAVLVPELKAWWDAHGRPLAGPVFPSRQGKRAGLRKQGKTSYAWHLREALWKAGIARPLEGFEEARAEWLRLVEAESARNESAKLSKKSRKWTERQAARAAIATAEQKARAL